MDNSKTENMSNFGIIRYNSNPGTVPGYAVYRETEQKVVTDYNKIIGYDWEEEDIGSWMGVRRVQRPIYAEKIVLHHTWFAIPEANVKAWEAQFD